MRYQYYKQGPTNVLFCTLKFPVLLSSQKHHVKKTSCKCRQLYANKNKGKLLTKANYILQSTNAPDKSVIKREKNEMIFIQFSRLKRLPRIGLRVEWVLIEVGREQTCGNKSSFLYISSLELCPQSKGCYRSQN